VKVKITTVCSRIIKEKDFTSVPEDGILSLELTDDGNNELANGVYYVAVMCDYRQSVIKLLILR
jgi:hypothetical protein